jgi:putative membrane-bound dehydrogenase-like protein
MKTLSVMKGKMKICSVKQTGWFFLLLSAMVLTGMGCGKKKLSTGLTPEQALETFTLDDGFKIELVASEPLLGDPTDMEIDEFGRMYVVEMHGYPLDKSGSGKIKLLTDENGDGVMDKSVEFAGGLTLPNSLMRWKKGILVADAPNLLYFEDTDNDGIADIRDTLLTGFALSNPQHNVNSPVYGMDNWVYLGHEGATATKYFQEELGDLGSEVHFPAKPELRLPKNADGRSVRFQPDKFLIETTASNTQFGHVFDAWGNRMLVSNANHIFHEVITAPYLRRNPAQLVSNATQSISDHGDACEVFPTTLNPMNQLLTDVGVITSACGITTYLGGAFPEKYNGDNIVLMAEPVSNLVHADILKPKGASFTASRVLERKEFLSSTDAWFRPVNLYVGPDGALYVVDYYRQIIEHPEWMGEEVAASGELYNGTNKGRIYRISRKDAPAADWNLKLGAASTPELVEYLGHRNYWWRINAQRLLVDKGGREAVPLLETMVRNNKQPYARLHALWTLEGLGALAPALIIPSLADADAGVRENAIKLAELHLKADPAVGSALLRMQNDTNAKVRFQLLCTIGSLDGAEAAAVRNKLLFEDVEDKWVQVAALSAASSQTAALLNQVIDRFRPGSGAYASLVQRLATMIGSGGDPATIRGLVERAVRVGSKEQAEWQGAALSGIAQGIRSQNAVFAGEHALLIRTFFEHPASPVRKAAFSLLKAIGIPDEAEATNAIGRALKNVGNKSLPEGVRAEAADFLQLRNPAANADALKALIVPQEPLPVQMAALRTLGAIPDLSVCKYLLDQWEVLTPAVQDAALNMFMINPERSNLLLGAIESGKVLQTSLGWPRTQYMLGNPDSSVRARARPLFVIEDNGELAKAYQPALNMKGDAEKGRAIFAANCALCHQVRGAGGISYGPDLGTVHNWSAKAIMDNILSPGISIAPGFDLWSVEMNEGETVQGVMSSETPTAITLRLGPGNEKIMLRKDIRMLKAMNMSAMPPGLDKKIDKQQMADLLAFLKQN